jgi:hypothetical protein
MDAKVGGGARGSERGKEEWERAFEDMGVF